MKQQDLLGKRVTVEGWLDELSSSSHGVEYRFVADGNIDVVASFDYGPVVAQEAPPEYAYRLPHGMFLCTVGKVREHGLWWAERLDAHWHSDPPETYLSEDMVVFARKPLRASVEITPKAALALWSKARRDPGSFTGSTAVDNELKGLF